MGYKKEEQSLKHNLYLIENNYELAKEIRNKLCPYKKIHDEIEKKINSGELKPEDSALKYNCLDHSIIKFDIYNTHICICILWAKNTNKINEATMIYFEQSYDNLKISINNAFEFFNRRLELS